MKSFALRVRFHRRNPLQSAHMVAFQGSLNERGSLNGKKPPLKGRGTAVRRWRDFLESFT